MGPRRAGGARGLRARWTSRAVAAIVTLATMLGPLPYAGSPARAQEQSPHLQGDPQHADDAAPAGSVAPGPLTGRVAYITPRGQLAIVGTDGGEPRLLSPIGEHYRFPAFAPTGDRVAAIGATADATIVRVFDARSFDGRSAREVYRSRDEPPIYLSWSPDGRALGMLVGRGRDDLALYVVRTGEAGGEPELVATGQPLYWDWAPDGRALLVHSGFTGDGSRLAFGEPGRGLSTDDLDAPGFFQAPGISPTGSWVAYAAVRYGERRVIVRTSPFAAGVVKELEFEHEGLAMLSWNPRRDLLAVMAPIRPADHYLGPVRLLDAEDGFLETVYDRVAIAHFWSPDGSKLAVLSPVASGTVQHVQQTPGAVRLRLEVVHVDERWTRELLVFVPSDAFLGQFLPFFDQYGLSHRIWSPGSDALVVPMLGRDGVSRVVRVDLGGDLRILAEGDMPFWNVE